MELDDESEKESYEKPENRNSVETFNSIDPNVDNRKKNSNKRRANSNEDSTAYKKTNTGTFLINSASSSANSSS